MNAPNSTDVKSVVQEKYGEAARRIRSGGGNGCCSGTPVNGCCDPITSNLYASDATNSVPEEALQASLGCGNPTALAQLQPGETVLDLGSGAGIDVLLSAKRVGPHGVAYGLDMTDDMLALAEENRVKSGLSNARFLKGEIENIPLPNDSVDVVISNCVINLSADKDRVLREAFRVLRPGGRFAVSDVVVRGEVPVMIRRNMELWIGCIAGALADVDYIDKLRRAGFRDVEVEVTREYRADDARAFLAVEGIDADAIAREVDGKFASAFVRATKPGRDDARTTVTMTAGHNQMRPAPATAVENETQPTSNVVQDGTARASCCAPATQPPYSNDASTCCAPEGRRVASPSTKRDRCCD